MIRNWSAPKVALVGVWASFVPCLLLAHWLRVPPMPWPECFKLTLVVCVVVSPAFALLAWLDDMR